MLTFELPNAEQVIEDRFPSQNVGICKNSGTILIPNP